MTCADPVAPDRLPALADAIRSYLSPAEALLVPSALALIGAGGWRVFTDGLLRFPDGSETMPTFAITTANGCTCASGNPGPCVHEIAVRIMAVGRVALPPAGPRRPIYLDHHATTPLDPVVDAAMQPFFAQRFGNAASDHLIAGNAERLTINLLYWQPGIARADEFNELGQYGFGTREAAPTEWQAIAGVTSVFCFGEPSSYDATDICWTVGTTDPLAFLSDEVWFGFCPSDDEDYEPQEEQFRVSVNAWKRRLIGDCIPTEFQPHDIQRLMPTTTARITNVQFHYPRKKRGVTPDKDGRAPVAITARNAAGERKRLLLVA